MDKKSYLIAKELNDFSYWNDTPIEQIPYWEVRDILSHSDKGFNLSQEEELLSDQIFLNLKNNIEFTWDQKNLSIAGEAKVQHLIERHGYTFKCFELDVFPTNTQDLTQYLLGYSLRKRIVANYKHITNKTKSILINARTWENKSEFRWIALTLLGLGYGIVTAPEMLIYAFMVAYILCNCITITVHEYWVHGLIKPKNRIIGFISDYVGYMVYYDRLGWTYSHLNHHQNWKVSLDAETPDLSIPVWQLLISGPSPKLKSDQVEMKKFQDKLEEYSKNTFEKLNPESQFLEKHSKIIKLLSHILVAVTFGLINYIFFFLLQILLFRRYVLIFNELVTHYNTLSREEEYDHPWLFPICCGTAYHKTHHYYPSTVILGPRWVKYFNIQYYYIKLFYNLNTGAKLS